MSRIGRAPIVIPAGVTVTRNGNVITVKGAKGELKREINPQMKLNIEAAQLVVERPNDEKTFRALHGLYRSLIANMVKGVTEGWTKSLVLNGVGYRHAVAGNKITLNIGYSTPKEMIIPAGLAVTSVSNTEIKVDGIDKELLGQFCANIRSLRKPEPYHAYGIRYKTEVIARKEGKTSGKK